ncbi:MAG: hypothetical protein K0R98_13 [Rickettsiaceae bacterium]|nr:hypothetical protein [Rickettsiaceae bacterium]
MVLDLRTSISIMKKLLLTILITLLSAKLALAEPSPNITATRIYKVYVKGIHVGDLKGIIKDNQIEANIQSYGLAKKISKYESLDRTDFNFISNAFLPQSYYTKFNQRQGGRTVDIKYSDNGRIVYEQVTPPDKRYKRPAVKEEHKKGAVDPLTAFLVARQKIIEGLQNNTTSFSFNIYDGRRLAKLEFEIQGREVQKINRKDTKVIAIKFKRQALEGFTNNELKRIKTEEPTFNMYLSDDDDMLPIKANVFSDLGTAVLIVDN